MLFFKGITWKKNWRIYKTLQKLGKSKRWEPNDFKRAIWPNLINIYIKDFLVRRKPFQISREVLNLIVLFLRYQGLEKRQY